jgi:hypothetical protein
MYSDVRIKEDDIGKPRRGLKDIIKMDHKGTGWDDGVY